MKKLRMMSVSCLAVSLSLLASPALLAATAVPLFEAPTVFSHAKKSDTPKPTKLEKSYYNFEGVPINSDAEIKSKSHVVQPEIKSLQIESEAAASSITPLCTSLSTGTVYNLSDTATGGSYCYHFEITQRAKTTIFLTGQSSATDFALSLLRHEADDSLTVLGTSDQVGNADEGVLALTEPGDYYWYMEANASDGTAFQFGADVNINADSNELNDTVGLSTIFPEGQSTLQGNMDSAQDVDYFQYVASDGQDLALKFSDSYGQGEWIAEYFTGTNWVAFAANQGLIFNGLPAPFTLHIRVYPNPNVTVNPAHTYSLLAGSQIASSDMAYADTNENIVRLGLSDWNPYLTTQAHNELNWRLRVLDSVGNPVAGATVNFIYFTEDISPQFNTATSGATGIAYGTVTLPDCSGNNTAIHTSAGNTWETKFDEGRWNMKVDLADPEEVGVGGENYPDVVLGHICKQTLQ